MSDVYSMDLEKIASLPELDAITKFTALKIISDKYLTIGQFFKQLSDNDVFRLLEMVEDPSDDNLKNLLILAEMLSISEGCYTQSDKEAHEHLNMFCAFISCISLQRKGLVEVFYDKLSFAEEHKDDIICKLI